MRRRKTIFENGGATNQLGLIMPVMLADHIKY